MFIKIIKKFFRIKSSSRMSNKIQDWKRSGLKIGNNCLIYSNLPSGRDRSLLEIKNNVTISRNVTFLLHDSCIGTISNYKYTDCLGKVIVGNNCFIGYGSIILPGVELGDKTIVGAGSVVTHSTRGGVVICGNPARVICTIEDYVLKNHDFFV